MLMFASLSDGADGGLHTRPINARVGRVNGSCQIVQSENVRNQARNQALPRTPGFYTVFTDNKERLLRGKIY